MIMNLMIVIVTVMIMKAMIVIVRGDAQQDSQSLGKKAQSDRHDQNSRNET
jgi:hypothetical protein